MQNYSSYYIKHGNNLPRLLVGDFREEEKQNQLALDKTSLEISEIENNIKKVTIEEKTLKDNSEKIIEKQQKLKECHSQVLMQITKVRAEIRDKDEDTKSIEDLKR